MDFYKLKLYIDFACFLKMVVPMMAIYVKNLINRKKSDFVKILKFILAIIIVNFPQKCQFRLKDEFLKFLGIQPRLKARIWVY